MAIPYTFPLMFPHVLPIVSPVSSGISHVSSDVFPVLGFTHNDLLKPVESLSVIIRIDCFNITTVVSLHSILLPCFIFPRPKISSRIYQDENLIFQFSECAKI